MPENKPVIALMYDFDKTLCTKDMQEYTFIPTVGKTSKGFWGEANALAKQNKMDGVLAYMRLMLETARSAKISIRRENFVEHGEHLEFYPGVEEWFNRIKEYGDSIGVTIEHYIISSGLREIIEGSSVYGDFKAVFASEFLYDENRVACWPKTAVNYTTKTQYPFRINKGVLDVSNDEDLNKFTPEEERRVPFRNMIYVGDGLTDVPCMKQVKAKGGYSVAVYKEGKREYVEDLLLHNRVDYISIADYTEGSELDTIIKAIISSMSKVDALKRKWNQQLDGINRCE